MSKFPKSVNYLSTNRFIEGGSSLGNFKNFNLALHVNDNRNNVLLNRALLRDYFDLPSSMPKVKCFG